jgi:vitamin B12 transporter
LNSIADKMIRLFFLFFLLVSSVLAQPDSTFLLKETEITTLRLQASMHISKVDIVDSSLKISSLTLADLLSRNGGLFVKDNGGGKLATISIRGTSASQNNITWNGLALNTPTLGLFDIALFPVFFIDDAAVQYGGNGPLNGTDAIGGIVQLSSKADFNTGLKADIYSSAGSFNDISGGIKSSWSNAEIFLRTGFFYRNAENNYRFKDIYKINSPEVELSHSGLNQKGMLHEEQYHIRNNSIGFHLLTLNGRREIPGNMGSSYASEQLQEDEQNRIIVQWKHFFKKFITSFNAGLLTDKIRYYDNIIGLNERSSAIGIQSTAEAQYSFYNQTILAGINIKSDHAEIDSRLLNALQGYPEKHIQEAYSLYLNYNNKIKNFIELQLSASSHLSGKNSIPFIPAAAIKIKINNALSFSTNAAEVYRVPTLNDRFWKPGGNPQLKPEKGLHADAGITMRTDDDFHLKADVRYFYIKLHNWIQWMPQADNTYMPVNLLHVISQGTELQGQMEYHFSQVQFSAGFKGQQIIANRENDNAQLIYIPRITWQVNASASYKKYVLTFTHGYTGYRYLTSDNNSWLNPYNLSLLSIGKALLYKKNKINIDFTTDNIFNQQYQVIALRAMPGRSYRVSLLLELK